MVTIQLDGDKSYTAKEVTEFAKLALDFIGSNRDLIAIFNTLQQMSTGPCETCLTT